MTAPAVPSVRVSSKIATLYTAAEPITPTDNTAIGPFNALYIGVTGDVSVVMRNANADGSLTARVFKAVPVGILPVSVQSVQATATTATNILGLS